MNGFIFPDLARTDADGSKVRDLTPQTQAFNQEVNRQVSKTNDGMKVNAKVEPLTGVTNPSSAKTARLCRRPTHPPSRVRAS